MNQNQRLVAELAKRVEIMENRIMDLCDESDLAAADQAYELLGDLRAAVA